MATARVSPAHRVGLNAVCESPDCHSLLGGRADTALALRRGVDGRAWIHVRLPQRPNNVTGWLRRRTLGQFHLVHTRSVVDRRKLRITLYDHGRRRFQARVGIGAPGTPTPAGSFWIREKFHVAGNALYGTRAMGTAAYSDVLIDWPGGGIIGVHGTSEPALIPGRPSHGCIRVESRDINRLYALTPVPSTRDSRRQEASALWLTESTTAAEQPAPSRRRRCSR